MGEIVYGNRDPYKDFLAFTQNEMKSHWKILLKEFVYLTYFLTESLYCCVGQTPRGLCWRLEGQIKGTFSQPPERRWWLRPGWWEQVG